MASQTTQTRTTRAKKPQDHKTPSDELREEALADNPHIALLIPPGKLPRSRRIRAIAIFSALFGDDDDSELEFDLKDPRTADLLADTTDFIEAHAIPEENREKVDALSDIDFLGMATSYLALMGELMGSSAS